MHAEVSVWLLLGSNKGNVRDIQKSAIEAIEERVGRILAESTEHWTEPWGFEHPNQFLNKAIEVSTQLSPEALLRGIQNIEDEHGRSRSEVNGYAARTLDIDILFYGDQVIDLPHLTIPHKLLHHRSFALAPMVELCPEKVHPILQRSVAELYDMVQQEKGTA